MTKSKSTIPEAPATISVEQLAGLSNLTKRRLYQLAEEHKLPPPANGHFPMLEAIKRLFDYYQQSGPELAREKLLKLTATRKLAELEVGRVTGTLCPRSEISPILRNLSLNQRFALQNKLEVELPGKLIGLDAISIRLRMIETVNEICDLFSVSTRKWLDAPPAPPQA